MSQDQKEKQPHQSARVGGRHLYSQDSERQRQIDLCEFKFSLGYIRFNLSKREIEGSYANTVEVETEVILLSRERDIKGK